MKKLMFAVSAALCATVGFSDVTSQNVVGYNTVEKGAVMYPSVAACFVPVGGGSTFKLKEFVPTGMMGSLNDMILNPATTVADPNGQYIYVSLKECRDIDPTGGLDAMAGWWVGSIGGISANEEEIPVGQAFLGLMLSSGSKSFQSSGEAPTVTTSYTTDGSMYPFFGNYLPKTIKMKDIVPVGMKGAQNDMIQVLNPATTVVDPSNQYIYVSLEECRDIDPTGGLDAMAGWWIGSIGGTSANEIDVPAGTAFLGLILSGTDPITYQFPSVLAD